MQVVCHAVNGCADRDSARQRIEESLVRISRQIQGAKGFLGADLKLVVLPEYFLTGYPLTESIAEWRIKAALDPDGPEYEALARIAADNQLYLCGNAYETDRHFPGIYFQASFILAPSGAVVLRYRRLISMFAPTPHDVWPRYLDIHGLDGVFPVAATDIGRLACVASEEILFPEITRALALRGAEVILHSSSEAGSPSLTPKDVAKRARAAENLVWLVSANSGGIADNDVPGASSDGMSKIVDFMGDVRIEAGFGESAVACTEIDLAALRRYRRRGGMGNLLARQRLELFSALYSGSVYPPATMLRTDGQLLVPDRAHFAEVQRRTIERLARDGII